MLAKFEFARGGSAIENVICLADTRIALRKEFGRHS